MENGTSLVQEIPIDDPTATQYKVDKLDSKNVYIFSLKALTNAGKGDAIFMNATTLLDGGKHTLSNHPPCKLLRKVKAVARSTSCAEAKC